MTSRALLALTLLACACGAPGDGGPAYSAAPDSGPDVTDAGSGGTGGTVPGTGGTVPGTGGTVPGTGGTVPGTGGTAGAADAGDDSGWPWTADCKPWDKYWCVTSGSTPGGSPQAFCSSTMPDGGSGYGCCVTDHGPCGFLAADLQTCVPVCL